MNLSIIEKNLILNKLSNLNTINSNNFIKPLFAEFPSSSLEQLVATTTSLAQNNETFISLIKQFFFPWAPSLTLTEHSKNLTDKINLGTLNKEISQFIPIQSKFELQLERLIATHEKKISLDKLIDTISANKSLNETNFFSQKIFNITPQQYNFKLASKNLINRVNNYIFNKTRPIPYEHKQKDKTNQAKPKRNLLDSLIKYLSKFAKKVYNPK